MSNRMLVLEIEPPVGASALHRAARQAEMTGQKALADVLLATADQEAPLGGFGPPEWQMVDLAAHERAWLVQTFGDVAQVTCWARSNVESIAGGSARSTFHDHQQELASERRRAEAARTETERLAEARRKLTDVTSQQEERTRGKCWAAAEPELAAFVEAIQTRDLTKAQWRFAWDTDRSGAWVRGWPVADSAFVTTRGRLLSERLNGGDIIIPGATGTSTRDIVEIAWSSDGGGWMSTLDPLKHLEVRASTDPDGIERGIRAWSDRLARSLAVIEQALPHAPSTRTSNGSSMVDPRGPLEIGVDLIPSREPRGVRVTTLFAACLLSPVAVLIVGGLLLLGGREAPFLGNRAQYLAACLVLPIMVVLMAAVAGRFRARRPRLPVGTTRGPRLVRTDYWCRACGRPWPGPELVHGSCGRAASRNRYPRDTYEYPPLSPKSVLLGVGRRRGPRT